MKFEHEARGRFVWTTDAHLYAFVDVHGEFVLAILLALFFGEI